MNTNVYGSLFGRQPLPERQNWSPYARNAMPKGGLAGLFSGYGPFGNGPSLDPNHLAMQMRMYQMNPFMSNQAQYSYMPAMQNPGPFVPTPTVVHPQMGGRTNFATNQPAPAASVGTGIPGPTGGVQQSIQQAKEDMNKWQRLLNVAGGPKLRPQGNRQDSGFNANYYYQDQLAKAKQQYNKGLYEAVMGEAPPTLGLFSLGLGGSK